MRQIESLTNEMWHNPFVCRKHGKPLKWGGRFYYCIDCCIIDGVIPAKQQFEING